MPAVLLGAAAQARIIASHDNLEKEALEKSAKVAIEGITNIRTVAGLGREADFVRRYVKTIEETHVQAQKKAHIRGTNFCTGLYESYMSCQVHRYHGSKFQWHLATFPFILYPYTFF